MMPFAGSDFWMADLGLEFLHWPQQRLLRKEMRHSKSCNVLESVNPQPVPGGYARVVSWIMIDTPHGIVHADAYDAQGERIKQFDPKNLEKVQGEYQLEAMEMRNAESRLPDGDQVQPGGQGCCQVEWLWARRGWCSLEIRRPRTEVFGLRTSRTIGRSPSSSNPRDIRRRLLSNRPVNSIVSEPLAERECPDEPHAGLGPSEFAELYTEHSRAIYYLCLRLLSDPEKAEDATHDVFLKAFRKMDQFRGESSWRTWLYRIAINHCHNLQPPGTSGTC